MNAKNEIVNWFRGAYAVERRLEVTLKKISESDRHDPECRLAAAAHLEETRRHAQVVETVLKSFGSDTSSIKTGPGMMSEALKELGTPMSRDEQIKDLLAAYSMEHCEIACYKALIAAVETAGLPEVADACEQIISEEEQMAETIRGALPRVVQNCLGSTLISRAAA